jgi:sortase A
MKYLRVFGKSLISVGVGILMFVGLTLWCTVIYTHQQQGRLAQIFDSQTPVKLPPGETTGLPPDGFNPRNGEPVFRLKIPKLDVSYLVVEGVDVEDLKKGPGHYPDCGPGFPEPLCLPWPEAWPGEEERVIVSGHRTTYGAPFFDIDKLRKGDELITETKWGTFTYEVTETRIVRPDTLGITVPTGIGELVLTTCNPKYSAAQRLIVFGRLMT